MHELDFELVDFLDANDSNRQAIRDRVGSAIIDGQVVMPADDTRGRPLSAFFVDERLSGQDLQAREVYEKSGPTLWDGSATMSPVPRSDGGSA
jgi:hypothetical protein